MDIRVGYDIVINSPTPVGMLLLLYTHPSRAKDLKTPEKLKLEPNIPIEEFIDSFGNRCARILTPVGQLRLYNDIIINDNGKPDPLNWKAIQYPISQLPSETLQYLLASRYCEVDLLSEVAWSLFGETTPGWARVQAICDWIHSNITYGYEYTYPHKTAYQVYTERAGVCRDFTHLAITFCRCLNIPARYCAGYLGDIGVEPLTTPMDFHAWFEVFLGGQWYAFDARHNRPRIGRILMVRGRDATDTAFMTSFGAYELVQLKVWALEMKTYQISAA
ncbi:transglutaminase-like domain-containing protein [Gloeothece verrucosa]|uniref:Transglutaminase domain protein n=1 Tax=Gloeothece verrucosa (strain PCC 7822) TaxID=497965 RepID=E0UJ05_GLOV7|nr:transglutaminase family protein [Gloeothece verrucosa]ADN14585.1 transglutaminase domain protein [Gloeothece verrucosa PCC 7822]